MPQKELIPRPEIATTYTKSMTAQMAGVAGAAAASGGVDAFDSGAACADGGAAAATDGGAGRASAATDPGSTPIIYR